MVTQPEIHLLSIWCVFLVVKEDEGVSKENKMEEANVENRSTVNAVKTEREEKEKDTLDKKERKGETAKKHDSNRKGEATVNDVFSAFNNIVHHNLKYVMEQ